MDVWLPTTEGPQVMRLVSFRPDWGGEGERPIHEQSYKDGSMKWYGTGTAIAEATDLPIVVKVPFHLLRGRVVWAVPRTVRVEMVTMLKKLTQAATAGPPAGPGVEDAAAFPTLLEYLTALKYPTGEPREPACLIIVADAAGWRGCVSDKDNNRTLWKTSSSVEGLLLTIEQALAEDDPSAWRQAAAAKWKGKKRS